MQARTRRSASSRSPLESKPAQCELVRRSACLCVIPVTGVNELSVKTDDDHEVQCSKHKHRGLELAVYTCTRICFISHWRKALSLTGTLMTYFKVKWPFVSCIRGWSFRCSAIAMPATNNDKINHSIGVFMKDAAPDEGPTRSMHCSTRMTNTRDAMP